MNRRTGASRRLPLRGLLVALAVVLVPVLVAGGVGYRAFLAAPVNAPDEFLSRERTAGDGPVVVVAGASMVRASLSADWVGLLRDRHGAAMQFVNAGVNGHTTADLLARTEHDVIAPDPAAVVVLIGSNDVRDGVPLVESRANLTAVVERVQEATSARIALVSLPPLGEDLDSALNRSVDEYNAMLAAVAVEHGATHLPAGQRVADLIRSEGGGPPFAFHPLLSFRVAVEHHLLGRSFDDIAEGNGLHVLTDHIHLSERAAAAVAEVVGDWL